MEERVTRSRSLTPSSDTPSLTPSVETVEQLQWLPPATRPHDVFFRARVWPIDDP